MGSANPSWRRNSVQVGYSGMEGGVPYIDIRKHMDGFALIETIEGNIDKFLCNRGSHEQIKKAMLSRTIQKRIGCQPNREIRQIVITKSLKDYPVMVAHDGQGS